MNIIWSKLGWKGDYSRARPLCFVNQWIVQDIPSLSSQCIFTGLVHVYTCTTNIAYSILSRGQLEATSEDLVQIP